MTATESGSRSAFDELTRWIGVEQPIDSVHGSIRNAARSVPGVSGFGTCLVTCSDEYQGEFRSGFDRQVARHLASSAVPGARRTFTVRNLGGRVESGALPVVEGHFAPDAGREQLLLFEIAAHVGRRRGSLSDPWTWGELDRFGHPSVCCGALRQLLDVRPDQRSHPWLDQLRMEFGARRLEPLRASDDPLQMVSTAIVHALLQAESLVAEFIANRHDSTTHALVVPSVVVNQSGSDRILVCGWYHVLATPDELCQLEGAALRTTPGFHRFEQDSGGLRVTSEPEDVSHLAPAAGPGPPPHGDAPGGEAEPAARAAATPNFDALLADAAGGLPAEEAREVRRRAEEMRGHVTDLRRRGASYRVFARPLLRGALDALAVLAPEVGLAGLLLQHGHDVARAKRLRKLVEERPQSPEARAVLADLERAVQQLGHRDAQEVLDVLLAENGPLLAELPA